jgi:hypothetical protein
MRRLLSKPRPFYVQKINNEIGYNNYKYELYPLTNSERTTAFFNIDIAALDNEVILGIDYDNEDNKDLYIVKVLGNTKYVYSLSYDDFALSYLHKELVDIYDESNYIKEVISDINTNDTPTIRIDTIDLI